MFTIAIVFWAAFCGALVLLALIGGTTSRNSPILPATTTAAAPDPSSTPIEAGADTAGVAQAA